MRPPDPARTHESKLARLQAGGKPRVLELASGSGGLALGLRTAGFDLTAHVEIDPLAAATYARNLRPPGAPAEWAKPRDMVVESASDLVQELGLPAKPYAAFDALVAGLPCQAFARIGRSKLREVTGDDLAYRNDSRASLYLRFLEYVADTLPLVVIIENVPDILNFGGHNVPEEICDSLDHMSYTSAYTILDSAHYGVPQIRERLFLVAFANTLGIAPLFPAPTHFLELPRGYEGSRNVALKFVPPNSRRFQSLHQPSRNLPPAVSAQEAIGDLPRIVEHETSPLTIRRRRLDEPRPYPDIRSTEYARTMRTWPSLESSAAGGHVVRLTPRDYPIFRRMPFGAEYPAARTIAEEILKEALAEAEMRGSADQQTAERLRKDIVPPYDPSKFPNKWWKLDPAKPSRTLTAHIGKDTYSHIHYDDTQGRTISVREAARLQSFPDGFEFEGSMNSALRQIGNAVPPLLSLALARAVLGQLESAVRRSGVRVA